MNFFLKEIQNPDFMSEKDSSKKEEVAWNIAHELLNDLINSAVEFSEVYLIEKYDFNSIL